MRHACIFWIVASAFVLSASQGGLRAEAPSTPTELAKTKRSVRDLIKAGAFEKAIALAAKASAGTPNDGELKYLLAAALFDRSVELENALFDASARAYGARCVAKTVREHEADLPGSLALVQEVEARENRALRLATAGAKPVRELRTRAREIAARVSDTDRSFGSAALLTAWMAAYDLVANTDRQYFADVAQAIKLPDPNVTVSPRASIDNKDLRKVALGALAALVKREPQSPRPYLAAADWLFFTGLRDSGHPVLNERERSVRYQNGTAKQGNPPFPPSVVAELAEVRKLTLPSFTDLQSAHVVPLLERARDLDTQGEWPLAYSLYAQTCAADPAMREALTTESFGDKALVGLSALERARLASVEGAPPAVMLSHLEQACRQRSFSRPLYTSIPAEVRRVLLSGRAVWRTLTLNGFTYRGLLGSLYLFAASAGSREEKVKALLLTASVCDLLTLSDLPQDWMLGASKKADSLAAILRTPGIPDDLRARTSFEAARLNAAVAKRQAPLDGVHLLNGRVEFSKASDAGAFLTGPCVTVDLVTGVTAWAPKNRDRNNE